ncbi:uncharacterized protein LOC106670702 isoform X2 [Cimex lectularius]|uniref:JmjC domain-containing protein n=1 Tax=Cimex lectularius TaxID=79782 RepID=A0A8I6SID6_CIMLE|nr:uncharacterized protein LOC106670702 isoform X2 [Cimex lectularius]
MCSNNFSESDLFHMANCFVAIERMSPEFIATKLFNIPPCFVSLKRLASEEIRRIVQTKVFSNNSKTLAAERKSTFAPQLKKKRRKWAKCYTFGKKRRPQYNQIKIMASKDSFCDEKIFDTPEYPSVSNVSCDKQYQSASTKASTGTNITSMTTESSDNDEVIKRKFELQYGLIIPECYVKLDVLRPEREQFLSHYTQTRSGCQYEKTICKKFVKRTRPVAMKKETTHVKAVKRKRRKWSKTYLPQKKKRNQTKKALLQCKTDLMASEDNDIKMEIFSENSVRSSNAECVNKCTKECELKNKSEVVNKDECVKKCEELCKDSENVERNISEFNSNTEFIFNVNSSGKTGFTQLKKESVLNDPIDQYTKSVHDDVSSCHDVNSNIGESDISDIENNTALICNGNSICKMDPTGNDIDLEDPSYDHSDQTSCDDDNQVETAIDEPDRNVEYVKNTEEFVTDIKMEIFSETHISDAQCATKSTKDYKLKIQSEVVGLIDECINKCEELCKTVNSKNVESDNISDLDIKTELICNGNFSCDTASTQVLKKEPEVIDLMDECVNTCEEFNSYQIMDSKTVDSDIGEFDSNTELVCNGNSVCNTDSIPESKKKSEDIDLMNECVNTCEEFSSYQIMGSKNVDNDDISDLDSNAVSICNGNSCRQTDSSVSPHLETFNVLSENFNEENSQCLKDQNSAENETQMLFNTSEYATTEDEYPYSKQYQPGFGAEKNDDNDYYSSDNICLINVQDNEAIETSLETLIKYNVGCCDQNSSSFLKNSENGTHALPSTEDYSNNFLLTTYDECSNNTQMEIDEKEKLRIDDINVMFSMGQYSNYNKSIEQQGIDMSPFLSSKNDTDVKCLHTGNGETSTHQHSVCQDRISQPEESLVTKNDNQEIQDQLEGFNKSTEYDYQVNCVSTLNSTLPFVDDIPLGTIPNFQNSDCISLKRSIFPAASMCCDCTSILNFQGNDEYACRFITFRKFFYYNNTTACTFFGCNDEINKEELDLLTNVPLQKKSISFYETFHKGKYILPKFLALLQEEVDLTFGLQPKYLRKFTGNYRDLCDSCSTTVFNRHWVCKYCAFVVCLHCFKDFKLCQENNRRFKCHWDVCSVGVIHTVKFFVLCEVIPRAYLNNLEARSKLIMPLLSGKSIDYFKLFRNVNNMFGECSKPDVNLLPFTGGNVEAEFKAEDVTPADLEIDEAELNLSGVPYSLMCNKRIIRLEDPSHPGNNKIFQKYWRLGLPIVFSGLEKKLKNNLWKPSTFLKESAEDDTVEVIDSRTGKAFTRNVKKFWNGFSNEQKKEIDENGLPYSFKLKDYPSTSDLKDVFPRRYADFAENAPMTAFTHRHGNLNLADHLPPAYVRPDLGPKLYVAYSTLNKLNKEHSSTNLHLDLTDAVNIMTFAKSKRSQKDFSIILHELEKLEAMDDYIKRAESILAQGKINSFNAHNLGAIWHIFHAKDTQKIRELLIKVSHERNKPILQSQDPIHDQTWYIDYELRKRLKEEYGVIGYNILQYVGDAVFIPAGATHQVRNLRDSIKIACDFFSPENVHSTISLIDEFRNVALGQSGHEDKLQVKNTLFHTAKDCLYVLEKEILKISNDCETNKSQP